MTQVNVLKRSATLFNLSLAFIILLKLFRGQIYSVLEGVFLVPFFGMTTRLLRRYDKKYLIEFLAN